MNWPDLLIDIVRAGAEGNQELFRCGLEDLISDGRSERHLVVTLGEGARRRGLNPPRQHAPVTT